MTRRGSTGSHRDRKGERGQILVLFTIVLVVIMGFTALVIDLGLLRNNRQTLANAMDAGALAGGTLLPVDGSEPGAAAEIEALIDKTVGNTYPGLSTYDIKYLCLIGIGADDPAAFETADVETFIPLDCDPRPSLGLSDPELPATSQFQGAGRTRIIDCHPEAGDKCNIVVVDGNVTTGFSFGRVVGVDSGNTGVVTSSACRGLCGELPADNFDVVLTMDTSGSMGTRSGDHTRLYWAQAAANQLLDSLAASRGSHQVGLVRYSGAVSDPKVSEILSPLTTDFPAVRTKIAGLTASGNTPLKQGMAKGQEALLAGDRSRATQVHIILSDGRPWPDNATTRPTAGEVGAFKDSADQVFSVVIGEGGAPGTANAVDTVLMRSLAKPDDDTHYLRVVDSSELPDVFRQIAVTILNPRSHLIRPYPAPIVSSVGGGPNVHIGGKYFTGATKVTFGGAQVPYTVNSDTSITATAPNGTPGNVVHVQVTTPGGSSPRVGADQYTFP